MEIFNEIRVNFNDESKYKSENNKVLCHVNRRNNRSVNRKNTKHPFVEQRGK